MKNQILFTIAVLIFFCPVIGQNPDYADVAVIVNDNDATSQAIGNYFAQKRGISANRILHIQVPVTEETDSLGFQNLRAQVEAELMQGNLLDTINYLVTTKGMPLRVSVRNGCDTTVANNNDVNTYSNRCTCVESELSLILGPNSGEILQLGDTPNPYALQTAAFERDSFGIFIVSRLDGFNLADIEQLVDRGGVSNTYYPPQSNFLQDYYRLAHYSLKSLLRSTYFPATKLHIQNLGVSAVSDTFNAVFVGGQSNLVGHVLYSFDTVGIESNSYQPGAMVYAGWRFAAYSFDSTTSSVPDNVAGRLISIGAPLVATGICQYSFFDGTSSRALIQSYFDTTNVATTNAGTAFYRSTSSLSQQNLLIGDPKTRLLLSGPTRLEDISPIGLAVYPNPNTGIFHLRGSLPQNNGYSIKIYNAIGQLVVAEEESEVSGVFEYQFDLSKFPAGTYFLNVIQGEVSASKKIVLIAE